MAAGPKLLELVSTSVSANIESPDDLRARRRRLGISQQQLAVAAECSLSMVRLLEGGYAPPRSPTRERVERVLEGEGRAVR